MENKLKLSILISEKINNVLQNFTNVLSFCPSSIVQNARSKKDLNRLFCDDPVANEFLRLDHEIYIDKDDEDVKKFGDTIFNCVNSLCNSVRYTNNKLKFAVIPCGSFPLNVKIGNLDEFDYLLVWEKQIEYPENHKLLNGVHAYEMTQLSSVILDLMREVLIKFEKNENVADIKLIQKFRAINVQFSWLCSSKHRHSVSIDLAMSIRTSTTVQEFFYQSHFPLKDTLFEKSIDFYENMYWNFDFCFKEFDQPDTNIFDKQIFETCDRVSPNVRLCYRVLKFIRNYFFPCRVKIATNHLTLRHVSYTTNKFSSYLLKQVLFQEVIEFPLCKHWKNGSIISRIVSMLQKLSKDFSIKDIFHNTTSDWSLDDKSDVFLPVLENMIQSLCNGCEMLSIQRANIQSDCKESLEFLLDSKVIVNLPKSLLGGFHDDILDFFHVVLFKSIPKIVLKNVISSALYQAFCDIVESMDYIDLAAFSASDARKVIFLLQFFVTTKKEIGSNSFFLKLNSLNEMVESYDNVLCAACEKFHGPDYVEHFHLSKSKENQTFNTVIRLEEIFSAITWGERGFIYNCLDELQYCGDGFCRYMASEAEKQLLDKVLDIFNKSSMNSFKGVEKLWILVTLKFLKNMK